MTSRPKQLEAVHDNHRQALQHMAHFAAQGAHD
jgi:hypothetical protein